MYVKIYCVINLRMLKFEVVNISIGEYVKKIVY